MDFKPEVFTPSYWMEVPAIEGQLTRPRDGGGILVIGSGLAGVSSAYWLREAGFDDLAMVDFALPHAATFRNCGHILYGTVESMQAMVALHGREAAREIWEFSIGICHEVRDTIKRLNLDADYKQSGYLVMAIDETEDKEIKESIDLLGSMGFENHYVDAAKLRQLGFKNVHGARFEAGSAQAHPMKFRNGVLQNCLDNGLAYHSNVKVTAVEEEGDHVVVVTEPWGRLRYDAVVVAANAYNPLLSRYFSERRLVEPFRGQIITSKPLRHDFKVRHPHSFDHGYEYALVTDDNRLMIGGWRNNTPGGEVGTYDIDPNENVVQGLKDFVHQHYAINEAIEWEYSWAGIMAASKTGFPFIGPTTSPRIFTCAGFTGHGFSWAHGSAKLLADIMAGNPIPAVSKYFNPKMA